MPKLTPAKQVRIRRKIQSLVAEEQIKQALDWCDAKFAELKGLADEDMIVQLFEMTQLLHYDPPAFIPEIQTLEEIKVPKRMKSVEYLEKKRIKSNKKQTKLTEVDNMKDFWDNVEDLDDFLPFLKVKTAITYTLELVEPEADPRSSIDSFGNNQYLFDVVLLGISPKKALEDLNKEGYPLYEIGKGYAFAVKSKGRMINRFKELYENEGEITKFKFKRTGKGFQTDFVFMAI